MSKNTRKNKKINNKKINCGEILINVIRNGIIESIHSGHLLILDNKGKSKFSLGKNDFLMYPRSAIKAIQTSAMVRHGLNISDELLALVSSSHTGTNIHQQKVKEILIEESNVQPVKAPVTICGDIHG